MARFPEWYERLDAIHEVIHRSDAIEWLGRNEMKAVFNCSERDSIRLLHKFGAEERENALSVSRSALLAQLEGIRRCSSYGAFVRQRQGVAKELATARAECVARQFRVPGPEARRARLQDVPETVKWRRLAGSGAGRFELLYDDGADLMWQLAEFLSAAGVNREEFFAATEPYEERR